MSRPIPLTKPDGTVHAYACGVCGTIGGGGVARLTDEGATAVTEDSSRDDAERCCVCRTCRAPSPYATECADCRAKWQAKMDVLAAERAALTTTSVAAEDAEHYTLTVNGHALDVSVEDEFGVYTRATVRHRDADDPTRNDDWSKASRCGVAAILEACIGAAHRFDAEEVTLVPAGYVVVKAGAVEEAVAAEREACALACVGYALSQAIHNPRKHNLSKVEDRLLRATAARLCAAKIRARGPSPWLDLPPDDGLYWLRIGDNDPEPVRVTLVVRDAEEDAQDLYVRRLGVGGVVYLDELRRCAGGRPLRWMKTEGSR